MTRARALIARLGLVRYVPVVVRADVERLGSVTIERLPGGWARVSYEVKASRHNPTRPRR